MRRNRSVYSPLVTLWLLVVQRLFGGACLEAAVLELLKGLPASFWPDPCKRVREWQQHGRSISSNTGAYNQARQTLPVSVVEQSCDRIFQELVARLGPAPEPPQRAFLLDGSSMSLAHSAPLHKKYPPGSNQYREGHWPILRVLVAHDLHTGLAIRPEWGPMYGPDAVSEQALLEAAICRLPSSATIVGDINFGVFSVAWAAAQSGHPVVLRLSRARAKRLAGKDVAHEMDREIAWRPSAADRKAHPELPADANVRGRLIARKVQPSNRQTPVLLILFSTVPGSPEQSITLYGRRWNIETDLRTLKNTLRLDRFTSSTPDMVAKEINMGIAAYNLVRALTALASQQSGVPPRGYSFSKVRRILLTFGPMLADTSDPQQAERLFQQIMGWVQQSKLPKRRKARPPYPRKVWRRRDPFPPHHS